MNGVDHGWIIATVDTYAVKNLDEFTRRISDIPDKEKIPVSSYSVLYSHTVNVCIVEKDRHWFTYAMKTKNGFVDLFFSC